MTFDHSAELNDQLDENELYPSDFFDEDVPRKPKRKRGDDGVASEKTEGGKRRKLAAEDGIPELDLGEPAAAPPKVIWKSEQHEPRLPPMQEDGKADKVALLKDWRERFKDAAKDNFFSVPTRRTSQSFAVVIPQRPREEEDDEDEDGSDEGQLDLEEGDLANMTLEEMMDFAEDLGLDGESGYDVPPAIQSLLSKRENKGTNGHLNGSSDIGTQPSRNRALSPPVTAGLAGAPSEPDPVPEEGTGKISRGRKRKAPPLEDLDTGIEAPNGDAHALLTSDTQETNENTPPPEPKKKRGRKPKVPAKDTTHQAATGRKRKAVELSDTEDADSKEPVETGDTEDSKGQEKGQDSAVTNGRRKAGRPKLMGNKSSPPAYLNRKEKVDKPAEKKARTTGPGSKSTNGAVRKSTRKK